MQNYAFGIAQANFRTTYLILYIGGLSLDAEHVLSIFLVGNADVNVLAQVGHSSAGFLAGPQLAAVVQVAADLNAMSLGSLAGFAADVNNIGTQGRGDAYEPREGGDSELYYGTFWIGICFIA